MKHSTRLTLLAASAVTLMLAPALQAQSLYSAGHADIGVDYDSSEMAFEPHWHLDPGAIVNGSPLASGAEYEPDDLIAVVAATRNSPNGLASSIGVADGTIIFAAGSSTYQPNLGFSAEELDGSDWAGNITMSLTGWTMPGGAEFALYSTNLAGTNVADVVYSTFDPSQTFAFNSMPLTPGDHLHFQWGFTQPGYYDFEFTWTGTHVIDGFISTTDIFTVHVVPEPAVTAILMAGIIGIWVIRRRRSN